MRSVHRSGGSRALVVGASSGIGRELAVQLASRGSTVALAGRRLALLEEVAAGLSRSGGIVRAFGCDATLADDCEAVVEGASSWMGGIDAVYFMAGSAPLVRIEDAGQEVWRDVLDVNLIGAAVVIGRALRHLRASPAPLAVVTTHSMGEPWPWLGPYAAAKAGLAELARALRSEEPWLRTVCVSVGSTATSFADRWDPAVFSRAMAEWEDAGRLSYPVMQADEMASAILRAAEDASGPDEVAIHG